MLVSEDLKDAVAWFKEHKDYVGLIAGFSAQLDIIEGSVARVEELETLVHSSHEFMSGEWEPDDVDRAKFTKRLAEAAGIEDES